MALGFYENYNFLSFFYPSIPEGDFHTKNTTKYRS